ncbi:hypothetical protein HRI_001517100 [Hibiscus trionum]|uniref:Uncharacterized protein n=1 Tax=Hibiscus trionum TaxID=183268 RepID=A0A9W7HJ97_HIBTR|nr:hypothetical protein HRI_001517100 [Hibiscus trionum]
MFQHFICGAFDPRGQDGRRKSRKNSFRKSKGLKRDDKNPYSDRGLDKFSALLAELEEKKQKIYSQQGMPLVLFTYKNSTDIVPIVIRLKDDKEAAKKKGADTNASKDHHPVMKVVDSESEGKKQVIKKIS